MALRRSRGAWDLNIPGSENQGERSSMKKAIRQRIKRAAGSICVLALAGISFHCVNKPLAPVAPTWETQMTAPVSLRSYTLSDLISKDSSLLGITPGGTQLVYRTTFQADPTFFGNLVSRSHAHRRFSSASSPSPARPMYSRSLSPPRFQRGRRRPSLRRLFRLRPCR